MPASGRRVGASPRMAQNEATSRGSDSMAISQGQEVQVSPKIIGGRSTGAAPASATKAMAQMANTGGK